MNEATRLLVRQRAQNCCEYCRVPQDCYPDFTFHIEHIVARQHRGDDALDNLALACHFCNCKKGPNLAGLDPNSQELVSLFHPRNDVWKQHFRLEGDGRMSGLTPTGRATVQVLDMNTEVRIEIRKELIRRGR